MSSTTQDLDMSASNVNNSSFLDVLLKSLKEETAQLKKDVEEWNCAEVRRREEAQEAYKTGRNFIDALRKSLLFQGAFCTKEVKAMTCVADDLRSRIAKDQETDVEALSAIGRGVDLASVMSSHNRKMMYELHDLKRTTFQVFEHQQFLQAHHIDMKADRMLRQINLLEDIIQVLEGEFVRSNVDLIIIKRAEAKTRGAGNAVGRGSLAVLIIAILVTVVYIWNVRI